MDEVVVIDLLRHVNDRNIVGSVERPASRPFRSVSPETLAPAFHPKVSCASWFVPAGGFEKSQDASLSALATEFGVPYEVRDSRKFLEKNGFTPILDWASPYGTSNTATTGF